MAVRLNLSAIQDLADGGAYAGTYTLSDSTVALVLSWLALLFHWNWEGVGYELTQSEIDTIDDMVAEAMVELMIPAEGNGGVMSKAVVVDQKDSGVEGGTFTSGAWRTRDLNTILSDPDEIVSVADNQFTLPAGKYIVVASAPAYRTNYHKVRLWDDSEEEEIELGSSETSNAGDATATRSFVSAVFTLAGTTNLELQHICNFTYNNTGLGKAGSLAAEIYAVVGIMKVGE